MGLSTVWDDELSYLLTPALAGYELEHRTGLSVGNEEFQHAIRKNVPDGHTFKGFPIQFVHMNPRRALGNCLRYKKTKLKTIMGTTPRAHVLAIS